MITDFFSVIDEIDRLTTEATWYASTTWQHILNLLCSHVLPFYDRLWREMYPGYHMTLRSFEEVCNYFYMRVFLQNNLSQAMPSLRTVQRIVTINEGQFELAEYIDAPVEYDHETDSRFWSAWSWRCFIWSNVQQTLTSSTWCAAWHVLTSLRHLP